MAGNGLHMSYGNDKPPSSTGSGEADIANDPASSGFFTNDFKKHEDLKAMLDGNKDNLKLEAMKRIIGMVAKGKDASDLFPAVVKNVVSKNLEVKKLVYVYLTRYAEEQQDLALLSISTFQRALKDPNQLIRASALRVLSSIRVTVIVPIMMLAIKEAVMDMSPYVRKTAAHAIPKLYSLDPEQKDQLIEVIEKLLADKTTLVAGSAIQAFEEVCPERIDLIHKNYRKLCNLLVDVEEWGQVVIINMLTRYCRTQFTNPNQTETNDESEQHFYDDSDKEEEKEDSKSVKKVYSMDSDHRLLLRQTKPLLNSRNAAVVMSVAQLYFHCAPKAEVGIVGKALIRLLRSHKEVQYVVLSNIATMTIYRKGMFEPYLKSFYVRSNDPTHVKLLKLEILTSLATETNISTILREFQTYVTSADKAFAAATIQAIGRCASNIAEITDACLNGLVHLMSNRDEAVVAESVVVIKKLLQMQVTCKQKPSEHKDIIIHMAKMVDNITIPMARASILWLIGEYSERVPKIAPDVLRKMAKGFTGEEDIVKLQILNLAAKMCITNPKQTKLLCQYVLNLAKYDQNYDIRDRSRFLRQLVLPTGEKPGFLSKYIKKIFLSTKPAPVLESKFKDRDQYQLGTLSHLLNTKAHGYQELPDFPESAPDPTVRNVEVPLPWSDLTRKKTGKNKTITSEHFYSDEESSEDEESSKSSNESSDDEDDDEEDEDSEEESSSDEYSEVSGDSHAVNNAVASSANDDGDGDDDEEDEDSTSDESEEESSTESSSDESVKHVKKTKKSKPTTNNKSATPASKDNTNLLLDLDDLTPQNTNAVMTPAARPVQDILTPMIASLDLYSTPVSENSPANYTLNFPVVNNKSYELLNRMTAKGLSVKYCFTRTISIFNPKMTSIELTFTNECDKPMNSIKIGNKKTPPGMEIHDFPEITTLAPGATSSVLIGINFNDTTQPAVFDIIVDDMQNSVKISAPVGELLQPYTMNEKEFKAQKSKLTGMTENTGQVELAHNHGTAESICMCIHQTANVLQVPSSDSQIYYFAGKTLATQTLLLITVENQNSENAKVTVNCEKMVIGSMMTKDIQHSLKKS
ncbi:AP-3 complex subunit beta-2 isoform X1 [Octopus sinensis]|uniref:AP-3 complex subunit beta n=1 Tax=Octopus sinensis TaxID=2607531 RepID=A0A6P7THS7_9MOLL|nr:AP-3 complex subunit beta-2 isoform X1 [Octopus sinensis]